MSFSVGDRVKSPKGLSGTVQYVGKVSWASGKHLGVELDRPDGDCDGSKKGKKYFKCKRKYGMFNKVGYWTKLGGGKKRKSTSKRKSISKGKGGLLKDRTGKKKKGKKKKGDNDDSGGEEKEKKVKKQATPVPVIETASIAIQTDPETEAVENAHLCKVITQVYTSQHDNMSNQLDAARLQIIQLQKERDEADSNAKQLEYEMKQQSVELIPLREELEMKEVEIEDLQIKLEIAQLDNEELTEKLEESLDSYVQKVSADDKENAELVRMNQELQQQLTQLFRAGQELLDSKDKHINYLQTDSDYVESLAARLKDLLKVERQVLTLKTRVKELEDNNLKLADADAIARELTEYNNILEGELQDWREYVLDVEEERKVLEQLHENDDEFIEELSKEKKDLAVSYHSAKKELNKLSVEHKDLQKELFELRNQEEMKKKALVGVEYMNFAPSANEQSASIQSPPTTINNPTDDDDEKINVNNTTLDGGSNNANASALEIQTRKMETVWNENLKLQSQLKQMRSTLMSKIEESVSGQGYYVCYRLFNQYLPRHSKDVDFRGIDILRDMHRLLYKAKASRDLLERFYGDPNSAALKNPKLSQMSHTLCPMILTQENYIRAIQEGFVSIKENDTWKQKVPRFEQMRFDKMEETYNDLLKAIEKAGISNELDFDIEKLAQHEKKMKAFVLKHFEKYSPDKTKKDDFRVSKKIVLHHMSETHYRFQSLSIKLNQFNSKMFALVHAPVQTTKRINNTSLNRISSKELNPTTIDDDEEKKQDDAPSGAYEETVDDVLQFLKIGAVEKLFRLRNDVIANTKEILKFCQPVELGFNVEDYSANLLDDGNRTNIKWGQLKQCKSVSFNALQRVELMLQKIHENVKVYFLPRKRVNAVNRIIEDEEEQNKDGLITCLENAYNAVSDVRKIIGSTLHATAKTTDDLPKTQYDEFSKPLWEKKAVEFRQLFEKQKEVQQKLEDQEDKLTQDKQEKDKLLKEISEKRTHIGILQDQMVKEQDKSTDLIKVQKENGKLLEENKVKTKKISELDRKVSVQMEEISNKAAAIEKYKLHISRGKPNIMQPSHKPQPSVAYQIPQHAQIMKHIHNDDIEYSGLLQQTIQTLRRKVTELTMNKKIINCELNLKPLPFSLLRDKINNANKVKEKKKKKRRKKKKTETNDDDEKDPEKTVVASVTDDNDNDEEKDEKKSEDDNEDEYEWVTDTEAEEEENKEEEKQKDSDILTKQMEDKLSYLTSTLNYIRSTPKIIDLTVRKKGVDLGQDLIGRQMRLRDIHVRYKQIETDLQKQRQKDPENTTIGKIDKSKNELGTVRAQVEIPNSSLNIYGYDRKQRVMIPMQTFDRLQSEFVW